MNRRPLVLLLAALVLVLAGCSGVPTSSAPRTVGSIDIDNRSEPAQPGPTPGADARTIVRDFLNANAVDPVNHDTARKYLAASIRRQWSDATATIISPQSVSNEQNGIVTVTGRLVGSLNQNGVYTPQLQGTGDGGGLESFAYRIATVSGENRIADLPAGLILSVDQFKTYYRSHALYFFDQAHHYLVPDPRWTSLDGTRLNNWLLGQLAAGPRPELSSSVTNDTLPAQANARRISATTSSEIKIEVPGSSQLDSREKRLLAAQISATVTDTASDQEVEITDGGNAVPMPERGTIFTAREAASAYLPVAPAPEVFYLRGNAVIHDKHGRLDGKLRTNYFLTSIAVTQASGTAGYTVAGVVGNGTAAQLALGTQASGYQLTTVRGQLSRPAWAPQSSPASTQPPELWIGVGGTIERVVVSGNRGTASVVSNNANAAGGRIAALRLSPDGSRVALVIQSADRTSRLYIGTIVRSAGQVRIDALPSISPDGVSIDDVGWIGSQKLIAVGTVKNSGDANIFETNVDGSFWTGRNTGSLPGGPDSVTVAVSQLAWVSTLDTVWQQSARTWVSPDGEPNTAGTKPVYLE